MLHSWIKRDYWRKAVCNNIPAEYISILEHTSPFYWFLFIHTLLSPHSHFCRCWVLAIIFWFYWKIRNLSEKIKNIQFCFGDMLFHTEFPYLLWNDFIFLPNRMVKESSNQADSSILDHQWNSWEFTKFIGMYKKDE